MSEAYPVSFDLEINVEETYADIRKVQMVLYRTLGLLRRFGVGEDVEKNIIKLQRLIMIMNQARLTMIALQAGSVPIGWAMLGVSVGTAVFSAGDFFMDVTNG